MNYDNLDLEYWASLGDRDRLLLVDNLAKELPSSFQFKQFKEFRLGKRSNYIALFEYQSALFVLIPGGEVILGYDPDRPFQPNAEQNLSWLDTVEDYELDCDLNQYRKLITFGTFVCSLVIVLQLMSS